MRWRSSKWLPRSARARLTLGNVIVMALVLLVLGVALHFGARAELTASVDRELVARSQRLLGLSLPRRLRVTEPLLAAAPFLYTSPTPFRARVFDSEGRSLTQFAEDLPYDRAAMNDAALQGRTLHTTVFRDGGAVRVFTRPVGKAGGRAARVVQYAYPLAETRRAIAGVTRTLLLLAPVGLLIAACAGSFLTERSLRPVRQVTDAAARIGAADLSERLPVASDDEFSRLSETVNAMLARLEQSFEQQRRFVADASHELRTPLTVIKANAGLVMSEPHLSGETQRSVAAIDRAVTTMSQIVQDLLLLARADAGQLGREMIPVPITELLRHNAEPFRVSGNAEVAFDFPASSPLVWGNPHELGRLFTNLFTNAVRHTPSDGKITVSVTWKSEESVVVTITDTGEGIAPEHLPHLGERFYRAEQSRDRGQAGTGLGLAICASIVAAHNGAMEISSPPGEGVTISIQLPQSPPPSENEGDDL